MIIIIFISSTSLYLKPLFKFQYRFLCCSTSSSSSVNAASCRRIISFSWLSSSRSTSQFCRCSLKIFQFKMYMESGESPGRDASVCLLWRVVSSVQLPLLRVSCMSLCTEISCSCSGIAAQARSVQQRKRNKRINLGTVAEFILVAEVGRGMGSEL